ncbi:arginine ABC transporter, ATP-binding protein ArtM [Helicobacter pullorum MIT 98-5489]|uniref:Probable ABC transporter ATP-binding protein PEB1C n=1 Tax=Helicobacter pullorum MIT 98-5489 TaxID=537972 RepID=C5F1I9_9HELI|nr:amino acid ABC transporter ATP-binding protein [Helicobacter pullorum]HIS09606.1 amino acid ABC transporter ATP-binding protein [Candidatus Scatomorpha intestinipullorum]EEQ64141.1 arginine ABC transporter, ATP-binding protein ArtM [Helicobacter pullorum MIT 98-5489]KPH51610.1 glutamine ABC transporter ATP-binding protein [Helicobacter pullorum]VEJ07142.1 phosphate ABC transporter ATP-binding protein [Helicobacter pullorum]HJF82581.1 amino acid ABC transporter ATP-binding protein [Helicobac
MSNHIENEVLLEVQEIVKKFGNTLVLDGVSLEIKKGEVCAILGPSGCGKSTFLRCINGLENINEGKIIFKQKDIHQNKTDWRNIRQKIGMVFQNYELFPHLSVLENIILAPTKVQKRSKDEAISQAIKLLNRVGLEHKKDAYPKELSGGQKQRVAIVRALCMNPEIMLFDEVTASLDPEMVKEVLEVIKELAMQGMTMILVTHEMKFAQKVADKIVFFDKGKIVEIATPQEFFTNPKSQRAKKFLNIFEF